MKVGDLVRKKPMQDWIPGYREEEYGIGIVISLEYSLRHQVGDFPRSAMDVVVLWPHHGKKQEMNERLQIVAHANDNKAEYNKDEPTIGE